MQKSFRQKCICVNAMMTRKELKEFKQEKRPKVKKGADTL